MKYYIAFASLILLNSCVVTGLSSGLNSLTEEQNMRVKRVDVSITELPCNKNIYVVGEAQLMDYIKQQDSCIVYDWIAYCPSNTFTPRTFEHYCDSLHYTPIIVMSSFCRESFVKYDAVHTPLLFPDITPYNTDKVYKYMDALRKNLTGVVSDPYRYWVFKNGKFELFMDSYNDEDGPTLTSVKDLKQ